MVKGKMEAELERRLGEIHEEITKLLKLVAKKSVSRKLLQDSLRELALLSLLERHGLVGGGKAIELAKGKAKEFGYPYIVVRNEESWIFMPKKRFKESAFSDCEVVFDTSVKS